MLLEDAPARPSLIDYAMSVKDQARQVFLVHGEERAIAALRERLGARGLTQTVYLDWRESVEIQDIIRSAIDGALVSVLVLDT